MTGILSLRASAIAMCSFLVSTIHTALGSFCMSRMPPRVRTSFSRSRESISASFFHGAGGCQRFLLGVDVGAPGLLDALELLHPLQPLVHGGEVGEHAAEPALVD